MTAGTGRDGMGMGKDEGGEPDRRAPGSGCRLAIDTSTEFGSVAVARGGEVLAEVAVGVRARASEALMPAVDFALRSAGIEARDLGAVVVGGGPGSFTGVRIAGATAKGLVAALDVPLYAYSGLLALAAGVGAESRPVCALFDARRGEVYAACYAFPGYVRIETRLEPAVRPIGAVLDALTRTGAAPDGSGGPDLRTSPGFDGAGASRDVIFAGGGALRYRNAIEAAGGTIAPALYASPRAAALLWLAELDPDAGRVEDADAWEPAYLRASAAERRVRG